jgi:hypothetical protein
MEAEHSYSHHYFPTTTTITTKTTTIVSNRQYYTACDIKNDIYTEHSTGSEENYK